MNLLAGDIGGTKTLLGIYKWEGELIKLHHQKFKSSEWTSIDAMITNYLKGLPEIIKKPRHGCLALAGPITNDSCKLTNLNWNINKDSLAKTIGFESLELINDVCALIYGIPNLNKNQFTKIQAGQISSKRFDQGAIALIAAGTGLGIARGFLNNKKIFAMPSEGGHREFSPRTQIEWNIYEWLKSDLNINRLSIERIVSGTGLGHIARWRLKHSDAISHPLREIAEKWGVKYDAEHDLPALVSKAAESGDPIMKETLQIWLSAYGSAAGDLVLQELCDCGLWIAGGTASKQLKGIRSKAFIESMQNKGRFKHFLLQIPVMALTDPLAGLFSAACRAHMLTESSEKLF